MTDTPLSAFGTNALIAELRERGDLGLVRPEGGEQKRPAASSGGRPSGPSESRQEQDLAMNVPAPGLPAPDDLYYEVLRHLDGDDGLWALDALMENIARLRADNERLREALVQVKLGCLLNVRRAAFGPEIGVRYTEAIRTEIGNECYRLEHFIDSTLAAAPRGATDGD